MSLTDERAIEDLRHVFKNRHSFHHKGGVPQDDEEGLKIQLRSTIYGPRNRPRIMYLATSDVKEPNDETNDICSIKLLLDIEPKYNVDENVLELKFVKLFSEVNRCEATENRHVLLQNMNIKVKVEGRGGKEWNYDQTDRTMNYELVHLNDSTSTDEAGRNTNVIKKEAWCDDVGLSTWHFERKLWDRHRNRPYQQIDRPTNNVLPNSSEADIGETDRLYLEGKDGLASMKFVAPDGGLNSTLAKFSFNITVKMELVTIRENPSWMSFRDNSLTATVQTIIASGREEALISTDGNINGTEDSHHSHFFKTMFGKSERSWGTKVKSTTTPSIIELGATEIAWKDFGTPRTMSTVTSSTTYMKSLEDYLFDDSEYHSDDGDDEDVTSNRSDSDDDDVYQSEAASVISHDAILMKQADEHENNGKKLSKKHKHSAAIEEYKKCLIIRESILGRYHELTRECYHNLADTYFKKGELDNAIAAYRADERIFAYLNGTVVIVGTYEVALHRRGVTNDKIKRYESKLQKSTLCEKRGDKHRLKGEYTKALKQYKQAIRIEKKCPGNARTLPILYRKMAQTVFISGALNQLCTTMTKPIDWKKVDCINVDTNKQIADLVEKNSLQLAHLQDMFEDIQNGDIYYVDGDLTMSRKLYKKAKTSVYRPDFTNAGKKIPLMSLTNPDKASVVELLKLISFKNIKSMDYFGDMVFVDGRKRSEKAGKLLANAYVKYEKLRKRTSKWFWKYQEGPSSQDVAVKGRKRYSSESHDYMTEKRRLKFRRKNAHVSTYVPRHQKPNNGIVVHLPDVKKLLVIEPIDIFNTTTLSLKEKIEHFCQEMFGIEFAAKDQVLFYDGVALQDDSKSLHKQGVELCKRIEVKKKEKDDQNVTLESNEASHANTMLCSASGGLKLTGEQDDLFQVKLDQLEIESEYCTYTRKLQLKFKNLKAQVEKIRKGDQKCFVFLQKVAVNVDVVQDDNELRQTCTELTMKRQNIAKQLKRKKTSKLPTAATIPGFCIRRDSDDDGANTKENFWVLEDKAWLDHTDNGTWILERQIWDPDSDGQKIPFQQFLNNGKESRSDYQWVDCLASSSTTSDNIDLEGGKNEIASMVFDAHGIDPQSSFSCNITVKMEFVSVCVQKNWGISGLSLTSKVHEFVSSGKKEISISRDKEEQEEGHEQREMLRKTSQESIQTQFSSMTVLVVICLCVSFVGAALFILFISFIPMISVPISLSNVTPFELPI